MHSIADSEGLPNDPGAVLWVCHQNSSHAGSSATLHNNVNVLPLYQGYSRKSIVLSDVELVSGRRRLQFSLLLEQQLSVLSLHWEGSTAWEESEQFKVTLECPAHCCALFSLPPMCQSFGL